MFKEGDFVKVKADTKLESDEIVNHWAGKILEVYPKNKTCRILLDAQTLDAMSDSYLKDCVEEGGDYSQYIFEYKDLELSESRGPDEQRIRALERLEARLSDMEEEEEREQEKQQRDWITAFENSDHCKSLNAFQQEDAPFVADTFLQYMFNYEYVQPHEWTPSNVKNVCLDIVPRKITAEIETFENYGEVLIQFLQFLGDNGHISNSAELIRTVNKIKKKIPIEAKNPNNWGMAKSLMMSAKGQGFDLTDEDDMNEFMFQQQLDALNEVDTDYRSNVIPMPINPFKGIGRNQKISIRYKDGRIVENVKFKKVEQDLRKGDCEIIDK